jgi:hypothetical protein
LIKLKNLIVDLVARGPQFCGKAMKSEKDIISGNLIMNDKRTDGKRLLDCHLKEKVEAYGEILSSAYGVSLN